MASAAQMPARARTILAFDYGRRRIGVAVGQELTATARPLLTINTGRTKESCWNELSRLIDEWRPGLLLVGVSTHADGSSSAVTRASLSFAEALSARFGLPVETIDERLSSYEAQQLLADQGMNMKTVLKRDKSILDRVAATLILQSWFNQQRMT